MGTKKTRKSCKSQLTGLLDRYLNHFLMLSGYFNFYFLLFNANIFYVY